MKILTLVDKFDELDNENYESKLKNKIQANKSFRNFVKSETFFSPTYK